MRQTFLPLAFLALGLTVVPGVFAQDPVTLGDPVAPPTAKAGETVFASVSVRILPPYHIYGLVALGFELPTKFSVDSKEARVALGKDIEPARAAKVHEDDIAPYEYWEDEITFRIPLVISESASPGKHTFNLTMNYMACTMEACLPPGSLTKPVTIDIEGGPKKSKVPGVAGPVSVGKVAAPSSAEQGELIEVSFPVAIDFTYHIYGLKKISMEVPTTFRVEGEGFSLSGDVSASEAPRDHEDDVVPYQYWENGVTFTVPVKVARTVAPGSHRFVVWMDHMACTMESCLQPESIGYEVTIEVTKDEETVGTEAVDPSSTVIERPEATDPETTDPETTDPETAEPETAEPADARILPKVTVVPAEIGPGERGTVRVRFSNSASLPAGNVPQGNVSVASSVLELTGDGTLSKDGDGWLLELPVEAKRDASGGDHDLKVVAKVGGRALIADGKVNIVVSFFGFVAIAALMALFALLTPCVYPMIPITISFFTKQGQSSNASPVVMALVYCFGIVVSFTLIGVVVTLITGTGQGASNFAQNPWMQGAIAVLFIAFALSLFGMFEMQLPSSVMRLVGSAQGKGGYGGILALGFLFAVTTFTCTAAFVGTLLAEGASKGDWLYPIVGMLVFSTVLALPFFGLALFPSKVSSLPRSGSWLNKVKVCMGFVELAAAFKFLGGMDMALGWDFFTRPLVLSAWIGIFVAMAVYLFGLFKLPHDSPSEKIGVGSLLWGLTSLVFAISLVPGLSGDPLAEGVDAYLPREAKTRTLEGRRQELIKAMRAAGLTGGSGEVVVTNPLTGLSNQFVDRYEDARAEAKRLGTALFINFTGSA